MISAVRGVPPVVTDLALGIGVAVLLLASAITGLGPSGVRNPVPVGAAGVGLAGLVAGALAVRRRYPMPVLVILNLATLCWLVAGYPGRTITLAPLIACYTVAAYRGWRWGVAGILLTGLDGLLTLRLASAAGGLPFDTTEFISIASNIVLLAATSGCAGLAMGYHRAVLAATRARLARETQTREERARRYAVEERLRVARELHDVVGHVMATISVQAGVGIHLSEQRPAQALEALTAIKKISDEGLAEVKTILGVLRTDAVEPRAPRGGIDQLGELLDSARAAGVEAELTVDGSPSTLPATVDLAAYRIIQEALTNMLRHADARRVRLQLSYQPSQLRIRIRDDGTATTAYTAALPIDQRGHGIEGMRERALALSGQLRAGPHAEGGFEVLATLPIPSHAEGSR